MNGFLRALSWVNPFVNLATHFKKLWNTLSGVESGASSFLANAAGNSEGYLNSALDSMTGAHLTGAQVEANEMAMQNEQDIFQRQVAGMQEAGLNPALMYKQGAGSSAPSQQGQIGSGSMSDLVQLMLLPLQAKGLKSEIDLRQSEADVNKVQAQNIGVNLEFNRRTLGLREEALRLSNNLSREQKDYIHEKKNEALANIRVLEEQAKTEQSKQVLNEAQSILSRMESYEIVQMMPYKQALAEAQTGAQKAQAVLLGVETLYQQRLIDNGYIESLCKQLEAQASDAESKAVVDGITAGLKSGTLFDYADWGDSKVSNILEDIFNGMVTMPLNRGLSVMTNLLDYMPNVLLTPRPSTESFIDSSTQNFKADGTPAGSSITTTHSYR